VFGSYSPLLPSELNSNHPHRLNRFAQLKALSFVPPDGRFTLIEYRFDPSANKPSAAPHSYSSSISAGPSPSTICATRLALHYRPTVRRRARGRCRRALSRFGRDEYRRYGRWRVDVRSCTTHTALVPRLFRLYDPRHFPLRLATGPHRDAPAHVREQ
jgi:hypothetical protein